MTVADPEGFNRRARFALSHEEFLNVQNAVNFATTIDEVKTHIFTDLGIYRLSYHHFASVGAFDFESLNRYFYRNIPQAVHDQYAKDRADKDYPGLISVFSKGHAMWLSELVDDSIILESGSQDRVRAILSLVGDGLCIPLYGPNNRYGYLYVSFDVNRADAPPIFAMQIQALAQMIHVKYCLMLKKMEKQVQLTPREAEVLEFITYGKTNSEIAEILDISPNTVAGYVKTIFIKLDVSDRVSAAMRAQTLKVVL